MLAANYSARAETIREMYMELLWNPEIDFFAVYKDGTNAKAGKHNATNGIPFSANGVDDRNAKWICGSGHQDGPGAAPAPAPNVPGPMPERPHNCPQTIINYSWPCNKTVGVRELLVRCDLSLTCLTGFSLVSLHVLSFLTFFSLPASLFSLLLSVDTCFSPISHVLRRVWGRRGTLSSRRRTLPQPSMRKAGRRCLICRDSRRSGGRPRSSAATV